MSAARRTSWLTLVAALGACAGGAAESTVSTNTTGHEDPAPEERQDVEATVDDPSIDEREGEFAGADDAALCQLALDSLGLEEWSECARVPGGIQVPGGRADIVAGVTMEPGVGETRMSILLIQHRDAADLPTGEELGTAYDIPGENRRFSAGPLELDAGVLTVTVTHESELYGDTGDSDTTFAPVEDRSTRVTRCVFEAQSGLYACQSR